LDALEARGEDDKITVWCPQFASMLVSASRFDDADRVLRRAERQLGDDVRIATMHTASVRARLERHRGRHGAARRHARRAVEMIERSGVARLDGHVSPTLALLDLADGDRDAAIAELARGAKAANAADHVAVFADIVDAAVVVAVATGRASDALELKRSADAIRLHAQVQRGDPEQAELDTALAGVAGTGSAATPAETDRGRIADLLAGLAGR
jgi:ATP/maltotriose-dependent transcriptional regulator MalT